MLDIMTSDYIFWESLRKNGLQLNKNHRSINLIDFVRNAAIRSEIIMTLKSLRRNVTLKSSEALSHNYPVT